MGGGAPESSVGATQGALSMFWAPGLIWLVTRGGGGQGGRARGEMGGGAPESSVGATKGENLTTGRATKGALVPPFGLPQLV